MNYSEQNLRDYIEKCFIEAFKTTSKKIDKSSYTSEQNTVQNYEFEWIMIRNHEGVYQLYPIIKCSSTKIANHVESMLQSRLLKDFGIYYRDTDNFKCLLDYHGRIDYNFTQAMFRVEKSRTKSRAKSRAKENNISLNIFDNLKSSKPGECMKSYTYEKLILKYWNITPEYYKTLSKNDEKANLPDYLRKDWDAFKTLYFKTFGVPIGNYDIICSSGINRIY